MGDQSWRSIFVGREDELKLLHDAWDKAKDGNPQFVTFLAETGVGKTRLVQHFYAELTKKEDPDHYWPDSMDSAAASLAINPSFPETKEQGKIPWLWWGLRAHDRAGRNPAENFCCAVQDAQCKIEPHAISIIFNRQKKTLTKDMYIELIKLGCDSFVDWVALGGVVSKLYDASQLVLKYKEERKRQKQEQLTIHQITEQKKADLSDMAFDYVKTILDKKDKDAPTVPVILILDDAQWFDPTSLRFVELLWQAASKNGWPLLIVATHWVREWRQYETELNDEKVSAISFDQPPINLAHMIQRNPRLFDRWEPVELPTIDSNLLHAVLMEAFSGLSKKQQQIILGHVGGNPQYLDDLIRWIENNPRKFFGSKDCTLPLTDGGEKHIDNLLKIGHMALVRDRFEALEEDMRDLLGFGSYQGMSFIEPLIVEVVNRLYNEDDTDWQGHFGHAMHPYAVINRISKTTDEFTQRNVYQIAKEHLHDGGDKKTEFSEILVSVLCEWYESGKIADQPLSEREALLVLLCREIDGLNEHADLQVHAQMELVELYNDNNRASDAAEVTLNMVDKMPENGWSLELLSPDKQIIIINALYDFSHDHKAIHLCNSCIRQNTQNETMNNLWRYSLAAVYLYRGNLQHRHNHYPEAGADYQVVIDILQQLQGEMGETFPLAWKASLAGSHLNCGILLSKFSDKRLESMANYQAAIHILKQLKDHLGWKFPPEWRNDLASIYMNKARLSRSSKQFNLDWNDYNSAISIRTSLCSVLGRQSNPKWKNDLAMSYMFRGLEFESLDQFSAALADFNNAIHIQTSLHDILGDQCFPEWVENLAVIYTNRGALHHRLNYLPDALSDYDRAICIRIGIHNVWKHLPYDWKNDFAIVHINRGLLFQGLDKYCEALTDYRVAIDLRQQVQDVMDEHFPPTWKHELAISYTYCASLLSNDPDHVEKALADYQAAIDILQQLRDEMGRQLPPEWKNDLAADHMNRGSLLSDNPNHASEALADYQAAIDIRQQLRDEMGKQFPPEWKNSLAMCSYNFALLLESSDKEKACSLFSHALQLATSLHDEFGDGMPELWMQVLTASEEACKRCGV